MTGECSRKIIRNDSISLQVFCEKMVLAQNIYFFVFICVLSESAGQGLPEPRAVFHFFEAHLSKQLHPKKASKNTSISRSLAFIYLKCVENCDLFCENIFYTSLKRGMHLLKNACGVIYN